MDFQKVELRKNLEDCRQGTLALFTAVDKQLFCQQIHPEFSPIGWHLGHIAFTEAYWLLEKCQGCKPLFPEYRKLFAADGLPKCERQNLPSLEIIQHYLEIVRLQVWDYLEQTSFNLKRKDFGGGYCSMKVNIVRRSPFYCIYIMLRTRLKIKRRHYSTLQRV